MSGTKAVWPFGLIAMAAAIMVIAVVSPPGPAAGAGPIVMSQKDIRSELIGPPLRGTYLDGRPWDETYFADGRIDYRDQVKQWKGKWSFRGRAFCTFYNDDANGGCWHVLKVSANCYEFYIFDQNGKLQTDPRNQSVVWIARGWRTTKGSTCVPQVGV